MSAKLALLTPKLVNISSIAPTAEKGERKQIFEPDHVNYWKVVNTRGNITKNRPLWRKGTETWSLLLQMQKSVVKSSMKNPFIVRFVGKQRFGTVNQKGTLI